MTGCNTLKLTIVCILLSLAFSASTVAETLHQAVNDTLKTNPDMLISQQQKHRDAYRLRQAKAGYLPTINLAAAYGREGSKNTSTATANPGKYVRLSRGESSAKLDQMLFDGFTTYNAVKENKFKVNAATYNVQATANDLSFDIIENFLTVLQRAKLVAIAKQNLYLHQRTLRMIRQRSKTGVARKADLVQAMGRVALARANLHASLGNLTEAKTNYLRIVGKLPTDLQFPKTIPTTALPKDQNALIQTALHKHPQLKKANIEIKAAQAQYNAIRGSFYPRLDLELNAAANNNLDGLRGINNDYSAMLRASYNFYNGGEDRARLHETAALIRISREVKNRTKRELIENAKLAWNDWQTARKRLVSLREHRYATWKTVAAYKKQFQLGKRTLFDLLNAENEAFTASTNYVNDKYASIIARYRILNTMGTLVSYMQVRLPNEASFFNLREPAFN